MARVQDLLRRHRRVPLAAEASREIERIVTSFGRASDLSA
jgi:hypothetical protein